MADKKLAPKDEFEDSEYDVEQPGVKEGSPKDIKRDREQRLKMARDMRRGRR